VILLAPFVSFGTLVHLMSVTAIDVIDGRTARRNRNRDAVLDAMIELTNKTEEEPAIEAIAERAGVSYRSVYRYFDDRTELLLAAIGRVMRDVWPLFEIDQTTDRDFDERVDALISSRLTAYRRLAPLTRLAMRRAVTEPIVVVEFNNVRAHLREQLEQLFSPELAQIELDDRPVVVTTLDVMFQFEALEFLARYDGLDDAAMRRVLDGHVRAHLAAATS
jgi:TetR/AcrR family transcriptional regulator, regulator of autoinduction and epiphytic fitness